MVEGIVSSSEDRAKCFGCENNKPSRTTKCFKSFDSIRRHVERCQNYNSEKPTKSDVLVAMKNAQKKFGKNVTFEKIPEFSEWRVLVK